MSTQRLTLLYDGACPFCLREVAWLRRRDRRGLLAFADIAAPDFDETQYGVSGREVQARIHAVLADGTVLEGMPVFREAYARIGLGWLIAPTGWPILRPIFDGMYRLFAANRVRLGRLFGRGDACEGDACRIDRGEDAT